MKKIVSIAIILFISTLLSASEIISQGQSFDHHVCLNNRSAHPAALKTQSIKKMALKSLINLGRPNIEGTSVLSRLQPAAKAYYEQLSLSVKSIPITNNHKFYGYQLSSPELDKELNSVGTCEAVDSLLLAILAVGTL